MDVVIKSRKHWRSMVKMKKSKDKKLTSQLTFWEKAMRAGLMGGRPFSEPTIKTYTYYARWFLEQHEDISIRTLKIALLDIPPEHFGKRLKLYQALNSFAKFLVDDNLMEPTYLTEAKALKPKRHMPPKRTTVSETDIETLIAYCNKPMDQLLVILLSSTGLRVSEAAHLQHKDIDLATRTLTVRWAKWGKTRRVGIPERLYMVLNGYLSSKVLQSSESSLFLKQNGKPMDRYGIATRIEKLAQKSGIPVTPHALRRAFVTINANKGRPLAMLQIACGHSDITTTRSYCMTTEDETIEAMQAWS
jgi:integrase/recombinase XerD